MIVHFYTRCWNDADMLGFMFRHYDSIVDKYIVYDDGSTDGSQAILRSHPKVVLRNLVRVDPQSRILSTVSFSNDVWRESCGVADWVIIADIDEHLYHRNLPEYLQASADLGVTLIPALGYQMISDIFPQPADKLLCESLTRGAPWGQMSKLGFFAPDHIKSINYTPGRHRCAPEGNIILPEKDELLLLHYKYMDIDRTQRRHEQSATRSQETDVANNWGHKYFWTREQLEKDWRCFESAAIDVADPGIDHHDGHAEPRWWALLPRVV